jgi:hypothetical protein
MAGPIIADSAIFVLLKGYFTVYHDGIVLAIARRILAKDADLDHSIEKCLECFI